jgi:tRNA-dihydrouridine synthase A
MMDWTDRHCRYFLRCISPTTLLYTEMITTGAILRGDHERLLAFDPAEYPVALQLGGSEPDQLAQAAKIGEQMGYDEINLNCGCPSDRVHSGAFGACLMREPRRVADCVQAMRVAVQVPVTVKLRIGVIDGRAIRDARDAAQRFDPADRDALYEFVSGLVAAGVHAVIVHARKAVLGSWSPKDNREIPQLRYDVVRELKAAFPAIPVVLNGGIKDVAGIEAGLQGLDGVMLGREAYHRPMVLGEADVALGRTNELITRTAVLEQMHEYCEREVARGERLANITRHVLGLYAGQPGAREYRRLLSEGARASDARPDLLLRAASVISAAIAAVA